MGAPQLALWTMQQSYRAKRSRWPPLARMASRGALPLWLPRLSRITISPPRVQHLSAYSVKSSPCDGAIDHPECAKGADATRCGPLGRQPRSVAMLVLMHVSSIKNRTKRQSSPDGPSSRAATGTVGAVLFGRLNFYRSLARRLEQKSRPL
jgi:hypothetical protein